MSGNTLALETGYRHSQIITAAAGTGPLDDPKAPNGLSPLSTRTTRCSQENTMRHVDFSPLYRSTVGFDRLFSMLDSLAQPEGAQAGAQSYPPYNIERTGEDSYRITMAVAGFSDAEIQIEAHRNSLTVTGEKLAEEEGKTTEYLYRGIAGRSFERRFQLADHVEVKGAELKNGLLHIELKRNIPEEMKPRKIAIAAAQGKPAKQIEAKTAA